MPFSTPKDDMLEPEFKDGFNAWKSKPGPEANAAILKTLHPVIEGAVRKQVGEPNPLLLSRARGMALDSLNTYDPTRGKLQTHLYNSLNGLRRVNRQQTSIISVPERIQQDRYWLDRYTGELQEELGREPTDAELSDRLGFSMRRMARVRSYNPAIAGGQVVDPETGAEYSGDVRAAKQDRDMWHEIVYGDLDPYHQKVMELAFGLNGRRPLPNHAIAAKLGKSPGAISQAKLRIQQKLDEGQELNPFGS